MPKPKKTITELRSYYLPVDFPVIVLTGDHWRISDKPSNHLHFHNFLEIGFCHEGSGTLQVKKQKLHFKENDITYVARNIPHTTYSTPGTTSKWSYIMVDLYEMFDSFASNYAPQITQMLNAINTAGIIHSKDNPAINFLVTHLIEDIYKTNFNYQLNARSLFLSLLTELYRVIGAPAKQLVSEPTEQSHTFAIVPALNFIKNNYMNQFSVDTLADICGLSPTHFRRVFNNAMGVSPLEYLNTIRITKACHLLRSTEDSILNISECVGFHSISSFNRYFDRLINMSPREYRRSANDSDALQNSQIIKFNGWMEPEVF